jgi:hypothetical protein
MAHTAIVGRRLERPVINLGFSGNGTMDVEVAALLAELDPSAYVLDCLPNLGPAEVEARTEAFVSILRRARPATPIVLVEDRTITSAPLLPALGEHHRGNRAALRAAWERLRQAGDRHLHYLPGEDLLGDDGEGTVDGSHPTDLGFARQASAMAAALRPWLGPG